MLVQSQGAAYDNVGDVRDGYQTTYARLAAAAGQQATGAAAVSTGGQVLALRRANPSVAPYDTAERPVVAAVVGDARVVSLDQPYELEVQCGNMRGMRPA